MVTCTCFLASWCPPLTLDCPTFADYDTAALPLQAVPMLRRKGAPDSRQTHFERACLAVSHISAKAFSVLSFMTRQMATVLK